jgi:transposase
MLDSDKQFYLGGDVSKGYCDFVLLDEDKQVVEKNFQLDDTPQGHTILKEKIAGFFRENPQAELNAGVESTGGYENNWVRVLMTMRPDTNINVARLNSLGVSHNQKAGLQKNSTDKISAKNVAEYLKGHPEKVVYNRKDPYAAGRRLYTSIEMSTKQVTQLLNLLDKMLYTLNPSLLCYWKDEIPKWLLTVIVKWPTCVNLSQARTKDIAGISYVTQERALELKKNAMDSVASLGAPLESVDEYTVSSLAKKIINNREEIEEAKKQLYKLNPIPEIKILKSLPGISDYSAYGIMLEIGDIANFSSPKKLCSYFGIHPVFKESGDGKWGYYMSKQGRKRARRLLYLAAMCAIGKDEMMKSLYTDLTEKGRAGKDAICILMHKYTRIIYAMLKNNATYDPRIDKAQREKYAQIQKNRATKKIQKVSSDRRFQTHDVLAPISRRQDKKRQKQLESAGNAVNTDFNNASTLQK